ncbi:MULTISPECIES: type VII secretion protein EccCa [unclassified Nocardia]|nr:MULTISPECIES: type VII secretion protein EccCa [unclassified Nocardia]
MVTGPKAPAVAELKLQPPTELPRPVPPSKLKMILPVVMVAAMVGMMVMMFRGGRAMSPMMLFFPMMMMVSMVGMMSGGLGGGGNKGSAAEVNEDRKDYLRSITDHRKTVHDAEAELHRFLRYSHPGPDEIGKLVGGKRMWEIQAPHPQFLRVRIGLGRIANQVRVIVPEAAPTSDLDPVGVVEITRFAKAYSTVGGMPVAMNLLSTPQVIFEGDQDAVAALVRAMLAEIVVLHGPDQVAVAAALQDPDAPEWGWLKWLPHSQHRDATDGIGSGRMVYRTVGEIRTKVLAQFNRGPFSTTAEPAVDKKHLVLIVDVGGSANERDISGIDGCTWIRLGATEQPLPRSLRFTVDADRTIREVTSRSTRQVAIADRISVSAMTALARSVSPYRLSSVVEAVAAEQASGGTSWQEMVGIADPGAIRIDRQWPPRRDSDRARLNIPFGHDPAGATVFLDIKESAEEGMGPHGMCIGATGSGKSEFLRTLVLSAVATHSPDALNLLLVDFKGGATFLGFDRLSHVTAVVTNMEEESDLVTRMEDVINGEMARRQRILRDAGNFANVADYEKAREQGADLAPLPTLFIILDEFAELLEQYPDFAKLFVAIGRLGRSLRIHLLLSSQKVPSNRMGELEAHLSYRVALRTNQTSDSRDAIGTADAYHLPKKPGSGYLRVGAGELQRFQAAYVGESWTAPTPASAGSAASNRARRPGGGYRPPQLFTAAAVADIRPPAPEPEQPTTPEPEPEGEAVTVMETVLQQLAGHGRPAHKMWLPPLNVAPTLDRLVPAVEPGGLRIPLAIVDKPRQQRQDVWSMDLSGAGGHAAIVGGPQSGKSTALQTLILSAALTHTPEQVQFYCLDFSGGLAALRNLPHVGSVALPRDADRIRRTIALVNNLLASRQALFAELGIDSMREFRRRLASPTESAELTGRDQHGDVFLVVDGWDIGFTVTGPYYDEYMPTLEALALQGLNYGIHLVISSSRWAAIRPAMKDMLQTRVEMRLGDLTDTAFNSHRALVAAIPPNRPGRCISTDALHMLTALPRIDGVGESESAAEGLAAAIDHLSGVYAGRKAPAVKLLPSRISWAEIHPGPSPQTLAQRLVVPFGLRESDLSVAAVDFGVSTHMIVLGSSGSGKSTVIAAFLESIRRQFTPDQARVLLVDYRRAHMDAIPAEQSIGYLTSERDLAEGLPAFAAKMRSRRAPDGVTSQQLRDRSWWSGPEIFLVIDDYHMVAQRGAMNPLDPIKDIIVDGRDTGLHVIAARNIAQADMALYDNILGQVKNLNSSGLIMDGSKLDGVLIGDVKPMKQPTGRGIFVEPLHARKDLVQAAWEPERQ